MDDLTQETENLGSEIGSLEDEEVMEGVDGVDGVEESADSDTPETPEVQPRRKRVRRNKNEIAPPTPELIEARKEAARFKWPDPPSTRLTLEQAKEYLEKLTGEQLEGLIGYMYRRHPVIFREPKYIDKIHKIEQFTDQYIRTEHGGGSYRIQVVNMNHVTGPASKPSAKQVFNIHPTIPMTDLDPILAYEELDLHDMKNRKYVDNLRARGLIDREGKSMISSGGGNQDLTGLVTQLVGQIGKMSEQQVQQARQSGKHSDDPQGMVLAKVIDVMADASKRGTDAILDRTKSEEPSKMIGLFEKMLDKQGGGEDQGTMVVMLKMMEMMQSQSTSQMTFLVELMKKDKEAGSGGDSGMADITTKLIGMLIENVTLKGGGGGKSSVLETVMEHIPGILQGGSDLLSSYAGVRGTLPGMGGSGGPRGLGGGATAPGGPVAQLPASLSGRGMARTPGQAEAPGQPGQGGTTMEPGLPITTRQATGKSPNPTQSNQSQPQSNQIDPKGFITQYGGHILRAIQVGTPGEDFGEMITNLYGPQIHGIVATIGKERILQAIQEVPTFYNEVSMMWPKVEEFVDRFIRWEEILRMEGQEPGMEPEREAELETPVEGRGVEIIPPEGEGGDGDGQGGQGGKGGIQ